MSRLFSRSVLPPYIRHSKLPEFARSVIWKDASVEDDEFHTINICVAHAEGLGLDPKFVNDPKAMEGKSVGYAFGNESKKEDIIEYLQSDKNNHLYDFMQGRKGILVCGDSFCVEQLTHHLSEKAEGFSIQVDLSAFTADHSISGLIGSPDGYKGSEQGSNFVNTLKMKLGMAADFAEICRVLDKINTKKEELKNEHHKYGFAKGYYELLCSNKQNTSAAGSYSDHYIEVTKDVFHREQELKKKENETVTKFRDYLHNLSHYKWLSIAGNRVSKTYLEHSQFANRFVPVGENADVTQVEGWQDPISVATKESKDEKNTAHEKFFIWKGVMLFFTNFHLADPSIQKFVVSIIKTGKITTARGEVIDLKNCLIVATSPLQFFKEEIYDGPIEKDLAVKKIQSNQSALTRDAVDAFEIFQMGPPTPEDLVYCVSRNLGDSFSQHYCREVAYCVNGTMADASLVQEVLDNAGFANSDIEAKSVTDKLAQSVKRVTQKWVKIAPYLFEIYLHNKTVFIKGDEEFPLIPMPFQNEEERAQFLLESGEVEIGLPPGYMESIGNTVSSKSYWALPENMADVLAKKVYGQKPVLESICRKVTSAVSNERRKAPVGVYMFVGPSGTGKTQISLSLAEACGKKILRVDCSTWNSPDGIREGIFGETPNSLINFLRTNRDGIVLLDEVDKADPAIWRMMMGIWDSGSVSDERNGISVNARHAVFMLTSNYLSDKLGSLAESLNAEDINGTEEMLRTLLTKGAKVPTECIERVNAIYMVMPLVGADTYPLWKAFFQERVDDDIQISDEIPAAAEVWHMANGGTHAARSRKRTVDHWFSHIGEENALLKYEGNTLLLSEDGEKYLPSNNVATYPRARYWGRHEVAKAKFKEVYRGSEKMVDSVFRWIENGSLKPRPRGPVGAFLLSGGTGSGKSFLAETMASAFSKTPLIRVDCSQYVDDESINRFLFGEVNGKEGYLTSSVALRPDSVVLFDEFTRAPKGFFNQLMALLDQGRGADASNALPVDFKNCLFFLTTNDCSTEADQIKGKHISPEEEDEAMRSAFVDSETLAPEHVQRLTMLIPLIPPQKSADATDFVYGVIREAISEFGDFDDSIISQLTNQAIATIEKLDARSIRLWAESKVVELLKNK